jgi:predicted aspartyl protease
MEYPYDPGGYDPPAPVVPMTIFRPFGPSGERRQVRCLVDSGSDEVWLPENQLQALGCLKIDRTEVEYADGSTSWMPLYLVGMEVEGVVKEALEVIGGKPEAGATIGRRVLNDFVVRLDGPRLTIQM